VVNLFEIARQASFFSQSMCNQTH